MIDRPLRLAIDDDEDDASIVHILIFVVAAGAIVA
jgi:hypothetical protein